MATPHTLRPGDDPRRAATLQAIGDRSGVGATPQPAPQQQAAPGQAPGGGNPVAQHLAMATQALLETGPTPENIAAIQQFLQFLREIAPPPEQAPAGAPAPLPGAPAPTGPAPIPGAPGPVPPGMGPVPLG